ncbi:hypothetical protein CEXT_660191 [Caerostris extrusa]|uniref:Uncharacterized protein n=1 Tax=Caerostris extrusa TaxID=172846 RepID=A0AAV4N747_CAEEX|nr:hypothetical protein CEXT_660191 [Caerostris extrusa]
MLVFSLQTRSVGGGHVRMSTGLLINGGVSDESGKCVAVFNPISQTIESLSADLKNNDLCSIPTSFTV